MRLFAVRWRERREPLPPAGVLALGADVPRLVARLLERDDASLSRLRGVAGPDVLCVLGEAADLPWIDGVVYVGRDAAAPSLLLPTTLEPTVPPSALERALLARASAAPLAVVPAAGLVVPCAAALAVRRARLERVLGRAS